MRPAGEIRQALRDCFPLQGEGVATWRDALDALAQQKLVDPAAPSERRLVQHTVENMRSAGELESVKPVSVPGSRRPAMGYARKLMDQLGIAAPDAPLAQVMAAWR